MAHVDHEFKCLEDMVQFIVKAVGREQHVGDIERLVRLIKERMRVIFHLLPFKKMPAAMIEYLFRFVIGWLNRVPPKSGVSSVLAPNAIVNEERTDMLRDGRMLFGGLAEVYDHPDPTNTQDGRTIPGACLGPVFNSAGTYYFLSLESGRVVERYQFTERPWTPRMIARVEELAGKKPHSSLRFQTRYDDDDDDSGPSGLFGARLEDDDAPLGQSHRAPSLNYPTVLLAEDDEEESWLTVEVDGDEDGADPTEADDEDADSDSDDDSAVDDDTDDDDITVDAPEGDDASSGGESRSVASLPYADDCEGESRSGNSYPAPYEETRSDRTQEEESRSAHEESRSAATPLLEQPLVIEGKRRRVTRSAAEGGSTAQTYGYSNTAVSESRLGSLEPKQLTLEQVDAYLDEVSRPARAALKQKRHRLRKARNKVRWGLDLFNPTNKEARRAIVASMAEGPISGSNPSPVESKLKQNIQAERLRTGRRQLSDREKEIRDQVALTIKAMNEFAADDDIHLRKPIPRRQGKVDESYLHLHDTMERMVRAHDEACAEIGITNALVTLQEEGEVMSEDQWAMVTHLVLTQMSYKKAHREFGAKADEAVSKEFRQLHMRDTMEPMKKEDLTPEQRRAALETVCTVRQKVRNDPDSLKGRQCVNGSKQRGTIPAEETASPTVNMNSVILTAAVEAHEERDVAVCDLPGAYLSVDMDEMGEEHVHMILRGRMAELMAMTAPAVYRDYISVDGRGNKVLYVRLKKALYGLLKSALLFYRKLWGDLSSLGFEINPYDPCVANKMVDGSQMTVCWHVDDLKLSHADASKVTEVIEWLKGEYGDLRVSRGKTHEYLGMTLDYSSPGKVKVGMADFTMAMIEDFPDDLGQFVETPASDSLFTVRPDGKRVLLGEERASIFHRFVAKLLFLACRARRDIRVPVAFLSTRVKAPDQDDWGKLRRVLKYLKRNPSLPLTLEIEDMSAITWWVDASHAVHGDCKGHTGGVMSMGKGAFMDQCNKQKFNTRSTTESELVAVDEVMPKMIWAMHFLQGQGFETKTELHQDNMSTVRLEVNGKRSSGQRTRHLNIKYFFVTDQIEQGWLRVSYCPTDKMIADINTKPLQGALFKQMRAAVQNCPVDLPPENSLCPAVAVCNAIASHLTKLQECVGRSLVGRSGDAR